jgi:hypothetical protein
VWGGPPDGGHRQTLAASKLAYAPRGKMQLPQVVQRDLWEIGMKKAPRVRAPSSPPPGPGGAKFATPPGSKAMGIGFGGGVLGSLLAIGLFAVIARRKR